MKRDMDLCRAILLNLEEAPFSNARLDETEFPGISREVFSYHAQLLIEAGLINGKVNTGGALRANGLTWEGHDFVEAAKNQSLWSRAKEAAIEGSGGTALAVLKAVLVELGTRGALHLIQQ